MPAWLEPGDVIVLPAWADGLTLPPGAYVVTAIDGDDAYMAVAGEDAGGELGVARAGILRDDSGAVNVCLTHYRPRRTLAAVANARCSYYG